MWWGGLSPPARFLVPILPFVAPMLAFGAISAGPLWRAARAGTLVVSLLAAAALLWEPGAMLLLNDRDGTGNLAAAVESGPPLSAVLPTFTNPDWTSQLPRVGVWVLSIAAAFLANLELGIAATLAVLAHEGPHHVGDFIVLRNAGFSARRAIAWTSAAGCVTLLGGLVGYLALGAGSAALPYLLVIAASSFIYVALADLIPQLQQRVGARQTASQIFWLGAGIAGMMLVTSLLH